MKTALNMMLHFRLLVKTGSLLKRVLRYSVL